MFLSDSDGFAFVGRIMGSVGCSTASCGGSRKSRNAVTDDSSGRSERRKDRCLSPGARLAWRFTRKHLAALGKKCIPKCTSFSGDVDRLPAVGPVIDTPMEGKSQNLFESLSSPRDQTPLSRASGISRIEELGCDWFFHNFLCCSPEDLVMNKVIGRGSGGVVSKAFLHGQTVAVKALKKLSPPSSWASKTPELNLFHGISHPNLVQIYGVYQVVEMRNSEPSACILDSDELLDSVFESGTMHLQCPTQYQSTALHRENRKVMVVMEFCDRGSLWDAVKKKEFCLGGPKCAPLYSRIVEVAMEIACAMQHLHELHIVHGDLKPQNVMLTESGVLGKKPIAKVGDFGLCRRPQSGRNGITTFSWGTVNHMPPETLRDGKVHFASDVYSFGVLLVELITGKHPFQGMTTPAVILGVIQGMRPVIPCSCPLLLKHLIQDCWHADWQKRPTFSDVVHRLMTVMFSKRVHNTSSNHRWLKA